MSLDGQNGSPGSYLYMFLCTPFVVLEATDPPVELFRTTSVFQYYTGYILGHFLLCNYTAQYSM